jgi:hypothetical protein
MMANLTVYNIAIVGVICLGGFTYGFGFAVFTSSIGQPGFYQYFNLDREFSTTIPKCSDIVQILILGAATSSYTAR